MNPNRIDLNLFKVFDAILQTQSVTVAASNLGLTQSTVSNALNRLRDALGDPLFVRTTDGMMPTPRAEEIAGPIRETMAQLRQALEHHLGFEPPSAERTFKLFMTDVGQLVLLPKLLRAAAESAPHISIHTVQVPPFRMRESALENGDVDLAVGYFEDFEGPFHRQRLFTEELVCMVRSGHPEINGELSLEQFLRAKHLVYLPAGSGYAARENLIDGVFQYHGLRRHVAVRVAHFLGVWNMVSDGEFLVVLPRRLAELCATMAPMQIVKAPIPLPSFDVAQYWHVRFHHDPGSKWLRGQIAALYGAPPAMVIGATGDATQTQAQQ